MISFHENLKAIQRYLRLIADTIIGGGKKTFATQPICFRTSSKLPKPI